MINDNNENAPVEMKILVDPALIANVKYCLGRINGVIGLKED